jgi:hypothetical protein
LTPGADGHHHLRMKSLWMLCVLAAGLALGAACGPQEEFCPNTGKDGVCPIVGDDARAPNMDGGQMSICPPGKQVVANPDGNILAPLCE